MTRRRRGSGRACRAASRAAASEPGSRQPRSSAAAATPAAGPKTVEHPDAHRHRRGRLGDPQHVEKRDGLPRSCTSAAELERDRAERTEPTGAAAAPAAAEVGTGAKDGRAGGQAAEEQVGGNVGGPGRRLDDRPAVVTGEFGVRHHRPLAAPARAAGSALVIGSVRGERLLPTHTARCSPRLPRTTARQGPRPRLLPHRRQVAGGDNRIRRQAVHLGLVEQQESRAGAADAVSGVVPVQARLGDAAVVQRRQPRLERAHAIRRGRRTGLTRSGRLARMRASYPGRGGRSTACTFGPGRRSWCPGRPFAGR